MSPSPDDPVIPEFTSLPRRLGTEVGCAIISAAAVAPFISIIDKSITANASGRQKLMEGITSGLKTFITKPFYFFKQPSFLLIWGVYSGTYITANCVEAVWLWMEKNPFYPKFLATSFANVFLSVLKDKAFAQMFGKVETTAAATAATTAATGAANVATGSAGVAASAVTLTNAAQAAKVAAASVAKPLPLVSYFCFTARDTMTILASFSLPPILSQQLHSAFPNQISKDQALVVTQLVTPCAMQFLSTPLHLGGLDWFNNPDRSLAERGGFVRQEYLKTALARIGRIFPAYGIGGVLNTHLRAKTKGWHTSPSDVLVE